MVTYTGIDDGCSIIYGTMFSQSKFWQKLASDLAKIAVWKGQIFVGIFSFPVNYVDVPSHKLLSIDAVDVHYGVEQIFKENIRHMSGLSKMYRLQIYILVTLFVFVYIDRSLSNLEQSFQILSMIICDYFQSPRTFWSSGSTDLSPLSLAFKPRIYLLIDIYFPESMASF